ncbi:MAG: hypothetical protein AAGI30_03900 [Planctomycetota bacterium]
MTVFLCVIVPFHHRGAIALMGADADARSAPAVTEAFCPLCLLAKDGEGPSDDRPSSPNRSGCAICQLTATLDTPAPPLEPLEPASPAGWALPSVHVASVPIPAPRWWDSRGPPSRSALA